MSDSKPVSESQSKTRELPEHEQYSDASIARYESIFGENFVSPGGYPMAVELIRSLPIDPTAKVLDAGCGLGGSAFVMAGEMGFQVDAMDLSANMVQIARRKLARLLTENPWLESRITFLQGDCQELDSVDHYDAVYSRDVFLHIINKARLFSVLHRAMKPGGALLLTDYSCGPGPLQKDFSNYVQKRGYTLHTGEHYAQLVSAAGFDNVQWLDMTERFISILASEIKTIESLDQAETGRMELLESWKAKLAWAEHGDHRWLKITANKVP